MRLELLVFKYWEYNISWYSEKKIIGVPNWDNGKYTEKECFENMYLTNKITEIPEQLFKNSEELTEISIPKGITKIGEYAFWDAKL